MIHRDTLQILIKLEMESYLLCVICHKNVSKCVLQWAGKIYTQWWDFALCNVQVVHFSYLVTKNSHERQHNSSSRERYNMSFASLSFD